MRKKRLFFLFLGKEKSGNRLSFFVGYAILKLLKIITVSRQKLIL